jgi:hypothetical protein
MANFKYFAECGGQAVELVHVYHAGNGTKAKDFVGRCPNCGDKHACSRMIEYKAFPSKHECNAKCMGASGKSMICECKCGGKNHGRGFAPITVAA